MQKVEIVARWTECGKTEIEMSIEDITDGNITTLLGNVAQWFIKEKNDYITRVLPSAPLVELRETIWPTRQYYLYYAYHPNSGYYTTITYNEEAEPKYFIPDVRRHSGGHLNALWSEVIIFRI
jgi:hypothetical protein